MKKITLAYFGSPSFSALFLEKLLSDYSINRIIEVKLVVTQPDRPVGRKQILTPTPVKKIAQKFQIPISNFQTNFKFQKTNFQFQNIDLALVYAYSLIIPKQWLTIPKYGFWCVHPSLLPKYRGPSPIAYPLIFGEKKTGVTIFQMDEKIDHGPIISQEELEISNTDRRPDLEIKLTNLAFSMFKKIIFQLTSSGVNVLPSNKTREPVNPLTLKPQDDKYATYTLLLKKSDGFIPLPVLKKALNNESLTFEELPKILQKIRNLKLEIRNSSKIIYDYFRGLYPWPGLWTQIKPTRSDTDDYKRLKITDLALINNQLLIKKVQLEGKKEVDFEVFNKAYQVF